MKSNNSIFYLTLVAILLLSCQSTGKFTKAQQSLIMADEGPAPMRVYKITKYSDSILLRTASKRIKVDPGDEVLKRFVARLYATVRDSMSLGVGIAAPQVGILKNIIWVQRFDKKGSPFEVYFNPEIIEYSVKKQPCPEGCLSIPGRRDTTYNRAETIVLRYDSMEKKRLLDTVSGFTAVIFQHEVDHLNGILYLDHLSKEVLQSKTRK